MRTKQQTCLSTFQDRKTQKHKVSCSRQPSKQNQQQTPESAGSCLRYFQVLLNSIRCITGKISYGLKILNMQLLMVHRQNISDPIKALDMYSFLVLFILLGFGKSSNWNMTSFSTKFQLISAFIKPLTSKKLLLGAFCCHTHSKRTERLNVYSIM